MSNAENKMPEPMVGAKQRIEQTFDGAAASYDRIGPSIFTQFGRRLVEKMQLKRGNYVLDVATGTGAALLPAVRRVGAEGHITGIDLSSLTPGSRTRCACRGPNKCRIT